MCLINKFTVLPNEALTDHRLTLIELRVLTALFSFRKKDMVIVWPSRTRLMERSGYENPKTISVAISGLKDKGWVTVKQRRGSNIYTLHNQFLDQEETVTEPVTVNQETVTEPVTPEHTITTNIPINKETSLRSVSSTSEPSVSVEITLAEEKKYNNNPEEQKKATPIQSGTTNEGGQSKEAIPPKFEITTSPTQAESPTIQANLIPAGSPQAAICDLSDKFFAMFWSICPKRVGRGAALTAWAKAVKKADPERICAAMRDRVAYDGTLRQIGVWVAPPCNPSTWLNQERWDDDLSPPDKTQFGSRDGRKIYEYCSRKETENDESIPF